MATINFEVGVSPAILTGYIGGENAYVGSYEAQNNDAPYLSTNDIWCVSPAATATTGMTFYDVEAGIVGQQPGFSTTQSNAIEGILTHYYLARDFSPAAQEITALANWYIAKPDLSVSNMEEDIINNALTEANSALAGSMPISPDLSFSTFTNPNGLSQNFVNVSSVSVNLTPSAILAPEPATASLLVAGAVLCAVAARGKRFLSRAVANFTPK